ncbi:MAG: hemolysin family protein [Eubacteriales bacterium]|nr:hemolysin family protein [Eubacteriales bacterium]
MDSDSRSYWIITIVLLAMAAIFAITETAISSVSKTRIKVDADRGDRRAEKALMVLENFEDAITTLLICTNIVHILMASIVTVAVTKLWGLSAVSISTIVTTIVVFFAGEMLPKSIAKKKPEQFTLAFSGMLSVLMKIFKPLSHALSVIGCFVSEHIKGEPELTVTEDELYDIIEDMSEEGTIDEQQADLLSSALDFSKTTAGSIMTPIESVSAIDIERSPEDILDYVQSQNHSRLPVFKGNKDNIVGMLHIRKFMKAWLKQKKAPDILPILDRVYFTSTEAEIDNLLKRMSEKKVTMAVVRDSRRRTLGIVTVEDILEELVGEIYDEEDV